MSATTALGRRSPRPPAPLAAPLFDILRYRVARSHTLYFRLSMTPTRPSHRLESVSAP